MLRSLVIGANFGYHRAAHSGEVTQNAIVAQKSSPSTVAYSSTKFRSPDITCQQMFSDEVDLDFHVMEVAPMMYYWICIASDSIYSFERQSREFRGCAAFTRGLARGSAPHV